MVIFSIYIIHLILHSAFFYYILSVILTTVYILHFTKMRKKALARYRDDFYEQDSRPDIRTLRNRIIRGEIPGGIVEKHGKKTRYFIDMDIHDGNDIKDEETDNIEEMKLTGNPLIDQVLIGVENGSTS